MVYLRGLLTAQARIILYNISVDVCKAIGLNKQQLTAYRPNRLLWKGFVETLLIP